MKSGYEEELVDEKFSSHVETRKEEKQEKIYLKTKRRKTMK